MSNAAFRQLTKNIENRNILESLPLCAETERGIEIVSGHHRIRAARVANIKNIYILLDRSGLTRDQIIAKQLAHNSIDGTDDPQLLAELYNEIKDIDAKIEAFINPKDLNIPEPERIPIEDLDVGLDFKIITFLFLPSQLEKFDVITDLIEKDTKLIGIAEMEQYEKLRETMKQLKQVEDIRAVGMIISRMCDIVIEHYKKEPETEPI